MGMKTIKHSKYKNTGILFELLMRQITADVLAENEHSHAARMLKEYFNGNTELSKERSLYMTLMKEKFTNDKKADQLIDEVVKVRQKLDDDKLYQEKYDLVAEIKEHYPLDDFFASRIPNYTEYASIYKIFKGSVENDAYSPVDFVRSRNTISEHITKPENKKESQIVERMRKESKDLRILAQRIMIQRFNEKYGDLYEEQKTLLKKYINNISNTNRLREHINEEVDRVVKHLQDLREAIDEKVISIKIDEAVELLPEIKRGSYVSDSQVENMLMYYQLVNELKELTQDE